MHDSQLLLDRIYTCARQMSRLTCHAACSGLDSDWRSLLLPQEGTRLRRRAFHDAPFLTTSLKVIKSFILNADVHRGPQFLRFKVRAFACVPLLQGRNMWALVQLDIAERVLAPCHEARARASHEKLSSSISRVYTQHRSTERADGRTSLPRDTSHSAPLSGAEQQDDGDENMRAVHRESSGRA